jgi:hypothetical protein
LIIELCLRITAATVIRHAAESQPNAKRKVTNMTSLGLALLPLLVGIWFGCSANEPPSYERQAREFLWKKGVPNDLVDKLTKGKPLQPAEAEQLAQYENTAVLHLLGGNPGTPQPIVAKLSRHTDFEVRSGVAVNPNASTELLLTLRTVGKYTTVNSMLARNPRIPQNVLWEMHRKREAHMADLAMNPNCPQELMRTIAAKGNDIDRAWLATNPNLPADLAKTLANDSSPMVRGHFESNPTYGQKPGERSP